MDAKVYALKGDSLFIADEFRGLLLYDMSRIYDAPVVKDLGLTRINTLLASDTCLFAGIDLGGFIKFPGFSRSFQSFNDGLPKETMVIPRFGEIQVSYVYSIASIENKLFCGTRKGVFKTNIDDLSWNGANNGLPEEQVQILYASNDTLYAGIDTKVYSSDDLGDSWNEFHAASSGVSSIAKTNDCFYITTKEDGIFKSEDWGTSWTAFNAGLSDLSVSTITSIDSILVCGTSNEGFFYFNGNTWMKYNEGIICSWIRSITTTGNAIIANDEDRVYRYNGHSWLDISPDVNYELFGSVASMGDSVFLSVGNNTPFIVFSPDLGNTWEYLARGVPFTRDDPYNIYCENGNLYAYEDEIMYHTDDLGASWTELSLPGQYCNGFYDFIVYQGVKFALACGEAEMLKHQDNRWILSNNGLPASESIFELAKTSDALYAYVNGTTMYVSRDKGQNWSMATAGLDMNWWSGSYAFADKNIFIATDDGVYYSYDHGKQWYTLNDGLINLNLRSIALHHDTLYVGTLGNGIWKHELASLPLSTSEKNYDSDPLLIYPNPASDFIFVDHDESPFSRVQIIDLLGRQIVGEKLDANGMLILSGIPDGTFILTLITDKKTITGKLIIKH
jgi:photosystem II stability/assembly factor-like uncharacterized protein